MIDRQLLGDVVFAALIALPAAALARPEVDSHRSLAGSIPIEKSAVVLASAADRQIGLFP